MGPANILLAGKVVFLLILANGTPVVGKKILGDKLDIPIDGGLMWSDGQPLFGKAKTVRGVTLALIVTAGLAAMSRLLLKSRDRRCWHECYAAFVV